MITNKITKKTFSQNISSFHFLELIDFEIGPFKKSYIIVCFHILFHPLGILIQIGFFRKTFLITQCYAIILSSTYLWFSLFVWWNMHTDDSMQAKSSELLSNWNTYTLSSSFMPMLTFSKFIFFMKWLKHT